MDKSHFRSCRTIGGEWHNELVPAVPKGANMPYLAQPRTHLLNKPKRTWIRGELAVNSASIFFCQLVNLNDTEEVTSRADSKWIAIVRFWLGSFQYKLCIATLALQPFTIKSNENLLALRAGKNQEFEVVLIVEYLLFMPSTVKNLSTSTRHRRMLSSS